MWNALFEGQKQETKRKREREVLNTAGPSARSRRGKRRAAGKHDLKRQIWRHFGHDFNRQNLGERKSNFDHEAQRGKRAKQYRIVLSFPNDH